MGSRPVAFTSFSGGAASRADYRSTSSGARGERIRLNQDPRSRLRTSDGGAAGARRRPSAAEPASQRAAESRGARRSRGSAGIGSRAARATDFMRYANDNAIVRAVYSFVTGPTKVVFYGLVAVAVFMSIYLPVREYYIACRINGIYSQQLAQHEEYNAELEGDVDRLMTREGVADEAHERFGYVMPGETSGTVVGLDEDGTPQQASSDEPDAGSDGGDGTATQDGESSEGGADASSDEAAGSASVAESQSLDEVDSPWYSSILDALFFFTGPEGQAVSSSGAAA